MEQGEPLISVIIPLYNAEPYIEKCLNSLLAQTYSDLEIIVTDDASTDGGGRLCDILAAREERLQVVHFPENRGPSAARNEGIRRAKGKYVSFADADDYAEPGMLRRLYENLTESGADISICGASGVALQSAPPAVLCRQEAVRCLAGCEPFPWTPWGKLYRAELVKKYPFDETIFYSEDILFLYRVFGHADRVSFFPEKLYHYVCREGGQVRGDISERKCTALRVHEILCRESAIDFPEAGEDFRRMALQIDLELAKTAAESRVSFGRILYFLKKIQRDVRRHFSLKAFALLTRRKWRAGVPVLYVSTVAFCVSALANRQLKRWEGKGRCDGNIP